MLFIILILFLNFIELLLSQNCQNYQLQENELFYSKYGSALMIEQDNLNFNNVEYRINQNIIEKSFTIMLLLQGQVIQSKVMESLNNTQKLQKWICHLMKQQSYFITYTNVFGINDTNYEFTQNNIVEINSKQEEICEEFFKSKNNQFIVFCYSINNLNVYTISIQNNLTQILYQYNLSNLNITQCQKSYIELQNYQFILAFHQCENWNIIHLDQNKILLNQTILQLMNNDIQIKQLQDIQICVKQHNQQLILIEDHFYILFDFVKLLFSIPNTFERKIKKVILSKTCKLNYVFTELNTNQIFIWNTELQLKFNSYSKIYFVNDRIFIQNENEIAIIFTHQINYKIQIPNIQIKFIKSLNYFYQINEELKQIQFYKYHTLQPYIKPTKKYLYLFYIDNQYLTLTFLFCYKIVKIQQHCQISTLATNLCQPQIKLTISKYIKINNIYYEFQIPKILEVQTYKQNDLDYIYQCKLSFRKLNYTLLTYSNSSALFLKHDILRFTSCNEQCQDISINIYGMQLYQKNKLLWLFKLGINQARILQFDNNDCLSIQTFQIEYIPDKLTQFGTILIIQSKDQIPLIFNLIPKPDQQIKQYLSENLYINNDIIFYKELQKYKYIQYTNILILQQEQSVNYIRIQDIQIIEIIEYGFGFQVIGVHISQNILIHYYILDSEIQHSKNATYQDFAFVRPIVYQINLNQLILLAIQQEQMYLLIITQYDDYQLQLISSIKCNSKHFLFQNENLIYQDENNQMIQRNIKNIDILINNLNSTQRQLLDQKTYPIELISQINDKITECQYNLNILNECYQLQLNQFIEKKLLTKQIVLAKYFYGPIDNVSISNNTNLSLRGPFLISQQLLECKSRFKLNCILKAKFINNKNEVECYNIILNNQIHHITCQKLNQNNDQTLDLIIFQITKYTLIQFWIDEYLQACYYQILSYDNKTEYFIQESIYQIEIVINNINPFLVKKIGKLILVQIGNQQKLFYFQFNKLVSISYKFEFNNLINFENNENIFLEYQFIKTGIQLEIQLNLLKLEDTSISILGIIILNYFQLQDLITPIIPFNEISLNFLVFIQSDFAILRCKFEQDSIYIQMSQKLSKYLIIYDLKFNKLYQYELGIVSKIIRNCNYLNKQIYIDNQTLICENKIFDLRLEQSFYDHIHLIIQEDYKIHLFNTTHVIFESINNSQFYFGQFGYEIQQLNIEKEVEKFNLVAKNNIITLKVELMLINNIQNKEGFSYLMLLLILLLIVIGFIIYQIRRQRLKIKYSF